MGGGDWHAAMVLVRLPGWGGGGYTQDVEVVCAAHPHGPFNS